MPLGNPFGGAGYVAEYQSSALPWVTASVATAQPKEWDFNYVTRFVSVVNSGPASGSLSIAFTYSGSIGSNKVILPTNTVFTCEWRCTKVFIKDEGGAPNYSLAVGLTTIPAGNFPVLTGSFPDGTTNWQGVG